MAVGLDMAFATRAPNTAEEERLRLVLSTFCDGSGMNSGGRLPGWRDVERTVAAVFDGKGSEDKSVFDVAVTPAGATADVGISVKCKELAGADAMSKLNDGGRVYMELANSPAKFWAALKVAGLNEEAFTSQQNADRFGRLY